jgi:hypothetical protein
MGRQTACNADRPIMQWKIRGDDPTRGTVTQLVGMSSVVNSPFFVLAISLAAQCAAAFVGDLFRRRRRHLSEDERKDFDTLQAAALTLLALIIGFSFSMAVTRYDQRKNCEEAEANALGTQYVRADLLPAGDAKDVRALLRRYLDQRVLFYLTPRRSSFRERPINQLCKSAALVASVRLTAAATPTATPCPPRPQSPAGNATSLSMPWLHRSIGSRTSGRDGWRMARRLSPSIPLLLRP